MANSKTYANGTMKVANVNGELVPFIPKTGTECIYDYSTGKSIVSTMMDIEESIRVAASGNESVRVFNMEPSSSIYEVSPNESLFVLMENDPNVWKLTVRSVYGSSSLGYPSTGYFSAVPFNLYNRTGAEIKIDWGDGTTSTLTKSNYTSSNTSSSLHKYSQDSVPTVHEITVTSPDFSKTALMSSMQGVGSTDSTRTALKAFRESLISIDSPIPRVGGMYYYESNSTSATFYSNSLRGVLFDCKQIESLCSGIFDCNPNVTDFSYAFGIYTSLNCNVVEIPTQLFRYNTNVTNFSGLFSGRPLKRIPEDLFKYVENNVDIEFAFYNFSPWNPIESVPLNLFWHNKNLTSLKNLSLQCSRFELRIGSPFIEDADEFLNVGTGANAPILNPNERIVYVENGSTTHETFNQIAASQKLTIIGV